MDRKKRMMVGCIEKNRWMGGRKEGYKIDGQLDGYTSIYEIIYGWLDGNKNNTNQMNGWIEKKMMVGGLKKMDGWMDKKLDKKQMDG